MFVRQEARSKVAALVIACLIVVAGLVAYRHVHASKISPSPRNTSSIARSERAAKSEAPIFMTDIASTWNTRLLGTGTYSACVRGYVGKKYQDPVKFRCSWSSTGFYSFNDSFRPKMQQLHDSFLQLAWTADKKRDLLQMLTTNTADMLDDNPVDRPNGRPVESLDAILSGYSKNSFYVDINYARKTDDFSRLVHYQQRPEIMVSTTPYYEQSRPFGAASLKNSLQEDRYVVAITITKVYFADPASWQGFYQ